MTRNYRAEYARRIASAEVRGFSRSQARGHPRVGEAPVTRRSPAAIYDPTLEEGIRAIRSGQSLHWAARSFGISAERLRDYGLRADVLAKQSGRWAITDDTRSRVVAVYSGGRERAVTVAGYADAAYVGRYMAAVGQFLATNDPAHLAPFRGEGIRDARDELHLFETDPNELYRLTSAGPTSFEQVYRIVA